MSEFINYDETEEILHSSEQTGAKAESAEATEPADTLEIPVAAVEASDISGEQSDTMSEATEDATPESAESGSTVAFGRRMPGESADISPEYRVLSSEEQRAVDEIRRNPELMANHGHNRNAHKLGLVVTPAVERIIERDAMGYSSDYYRHQIETAKNDTQLKNAQKHYREALIKEAAMGTGEAAEVMDEASDSASSEHAQATPEHYKAKMAEAIKAGDNEAYEKAKKEYEKLTNADETSEGTPMGDGYRIFGRTAPVTGRYKIFGGK